MGEFRDPDDVAYWNRLEDAAKKTPTAFADAYATLLKAARFSAFWDESSVLRALATEFPRAEDGLAILEGLKAARENLGVEEAEQWFDEFVASIADNGEALRLFSLVHVVLQTKESARARRAAPEDDLSFFFSSSEDGSSGDGDPKDARLAFSSDANEDSGVDIIGDANSETETQKGPWET